MTDCLGSKLFFICECMDTLCDVVGLRNFWVTAGHFYNLFSAEAMLSLKPFATDSLTVYRNLVKKSTDVGTTVLFLIILSGLLNILFRFVSGGSTHLPAPWG